MAKLTKLVLLPENDESACIANAIRKALFIRDISQTKFAAMVYASNKSVNEWANGKKWPTTDKWPDIKEILGVDITDVILRFRRRKKMSDPIYPNMQDINSIKEAKAVADIIVRKCEIDRYHISVVDSCKWLLIAAMGLTYSKTFNFGYDEPDWYMFRDSLESYINSDGEIENEFDELSSNVILKEEEFYEKVNEYFADSNDKVDNVKEYFEDTLHYWKLFNRVLKRNGTVYHEMLVAIAKIVDNM